MSKQDGKNEPTVGEVLESLSKAFKQGIAPEGSSAHLGDILDWSETELQISYLMTDGDRLSRWISRTGRDAKRDEAIAKATEEDEAKALNARRDELAREFDHKYAASYDLLGAPARRAIDRIIELEGGPKPKPKPKPQALRKMVRKLDSRNKRTSRGYVTKRDELIAILGEVSRLVSVSIVEVEQTTYALGAKQITVEINLGLTLERDLL